MKKSDAAILGIHIGHDRSAAILAGCEIRAAISQERLDRRKHSWEDELPTDAIKYVLEATGLGGPQLDLVTFTHAGSELSPESVASWTREIAYEVGIDEGRIVNVPHHDAHAYGTFCTSGLKEAAVAVMDGGGDNRALHQYEAESFYHFNRDAHRLIFRRYQDNPHKYSSFLSRKRFDHIPDVNRSLQISLGKKYEQITYLLGFGFGQAGKTMGLAPFGQEFITLEPRVRGLSLDLGYSDYLEELEEAYRQQDLPYSIFVEGRRRDIAHDIQKFLEKAVLKLVGSLGRELHSKNLCLGGGVALNCVANERILRECSYERVWIFPAAGDDGLAVGSAFYGRHQVLKIPFSRADKISMPFWGRTYHSTDVKEVCQGLDLTVKEVENADALQKLATGLLEDGRIIGLFQGRAETGPRALGNRSILASPLLPGMKDRINSEVKFREDFRPFAPVVTDTALNTFFDGPDPGPHMLFTTQVRRPFDEVLTEVTHVDQSARAQCISDTDNPFLYALLNHFGERTGFPVLINTSFNTAGEPIVEDPRDAIRVLLSSELDAIFFPPRLAVATVQGIFDEAKTC